MEPRIQYAKTKDGVSIAYWTLGVGEPLVLMNLGGFSHIQLEWEIPQVRRVYERLAQTRMLVRYDSRGSGLSDRDVADYSLEAHLLDLEAVVGGLGSEQVALFPIGVPGPVAIAYAVRHPEGVSHLVLWCTYGRASDLWESPQVKGLLGLLDTDWELWAETAAHAVIGWLEGELAHEYAALMRESATPEGVRSAWVASSEIDVTALLPEIRSPTLIVHRRQLPFPTMDVARQLASKIPGARLVLQEGDSMGLMAGNWETTVQTIDEFLGEGEEAAAGVLPPEPGGFRTVLFTDVEGSTALECAIAMQRAFAEWNEGSLRSKGSPSTSSGRAVGEGSGRAEVIRVRIGLNAGEPIAEEDPDGRADLFGTAVNMAARIAGRAKAGEILASNVVRELVAGKGFLFADRGEASLKGFDESVRLYEVRWREEGS